MEALQQAPPARQNYIQSLLLKTVMEESETQEQPEAAPSNKPDPPKTGETGNNRDEDRQIEEEPARGSTILRPIPDHQSSKVSKEAEKEDEGEGGGWEEGEGDEDGEEDGEDDDDQPPWPAKVRSGLPPCIQAISIRPRDKEPQPRRLERVWGPSLEAMTLTHDAGGGTQASVTFSMTGPSRRTLSERELDTLGMLPPQDGSTVPVLGSKSTPQGKGGGSKAPTPLKMGRTPVSGKKHSASKVTPLPKTGGKNRGHSGGRHHCLGQRARREGGDSRRQQSR